MSCRCQVALSLLKCLSVARPRLLLLEAASRTDPAHTPCCSIAAASSSAGPDPASLPEEGRGPGPGIRTSPARAEQRQRLCAPAGLRSSRQWHVAVSQGPERASKVCPRVVGSLSLKGMRVSILCFLGTRFCDCQLMGRREFPNVLKWLGNVSVPTWWRTDLLLSPLTQ